MRLVTDKPWWWFITGHKWGEVAMTWGSNIYIAEDKMHPKILAHEAVHVRQHGGTWWGAFKCFIRSTASREYYEQMEAEAKEAERHYEHPKQT